MHHKRHIQGKATETMGENIWNEISNNKGLMSRIHKKLKKPI